MEARLSGCCGIVRIVTSKLMAQPICSAFALNSSLKAISNQVPGGSWACIYAWVNDLAVHGLRLRSRHLCRCSPVGDVSDKFCPSGHEFPALLQQIRPVVRSLHLALYGVRHERSAKSREPCSLHPPQEPTTTSQHLVDARWTASALLTSGRHEPTRLHSTRLSRSCRVPFG